ncbi:hypothetical protein AQ906_22345 [Burkholderia pseudomallei]|nr:hypothetical protein AQ906_22345 [Burkholderia pseudomallei]
MTRPSIRQAFKLFFRPISSIPKLRKPQTRNRLAFAGKKPLHQALPMILESTQFLVFRRD